MDNAVTRLPRPPAASPAMDSFREDRVYLGAHQARNERRAWIVAGICLVALVAQVAGGIAFRSMALTAAGLHMAAHVVVLLVAALSYAFARRYSADPRFAFGAGKIGYLTGFANAVMLAGTALLIGVESVERLVAPHQVEYESAIPLALAGLAVTIVSVLLLRPVHVHEHEEDLNLSAAHLHLFADALVSVLAIAGLAAGAKFGWAWADPAAGLLGAGLVAHFAWTLIRRTGAPLLDLAPSPALFKEVKERLSRDGERVVDLHLWRLGPGHHAAIAVIAARQPASPESYRARLKDIPGLSHVTVEVRAD